MSKHYPGRYDGTGYGRKVYDRRGRRSFSRDGYDWRSFNRHGYNRRRFQLVRRASQYSAPLQRVITRTARTRIALESHPIKTRAIPNSTRREDPVGVGVAQNHDVLNSANVRTWGLGNTSLAFY